MIHIDITSNWVYEHYYIYLHFSIAEAGNIICNNDLERLRTKVFKTVDEIRGEGLIKDVLREFRSHTNDERVDFIKENAHKFLRTDNIRRKVINDLEFEFSKIEESKEMVMYRFVRKVINNLSNEPLV